MAKIFLAGAARTRQATALDPFQGLALRPRRRALRARGSIHIESWLTEPLKKSEPPLAGPDHAWSPASSSNRSVATRTSRPIKNPILNFRLSVRVQGKHKAGYIH